MLWLVCADRPFHAINGLLIAHTALDRQSRLRFRLRLQLELELELRISRWFFIKTFWMVLFSMILVGAWLSHTSSEIKMCRKIIDAAIVCGSFCRINHSFQQQASSPKWNAMLKKIVKSLWLHLKYGHLFCFPFFSCNKTSKSCANHKHKNRELQTKAL